jgi:hypothetical protein
VEASYARTVADVPVPVPGVSRVAWVKGTVSGVHVAPPSVLRRAFAPHATRTVWVPEPGAKEGEHDGEIDPVAFQVEPPSIER